MPESNGAFIEVLRLLNLIVTCRISDEFISSPVFALRIHVICFSILCRNHIQSLSLRISAVFYDLFTEIGSNSDDIFHQLYRFCKYLPVHPLQDHIDISHVADLEYKQIRIVDMSASERPAAFKPSHKIKISNCFPDLKFRYTFHVRTPLFFPKISKVSAFIVR